MLGGVCRAKRNHEEEERGGLDSGFRKIDPFDSSLGE